MKVIDNFLKVRDPETGEFKALPGVVSGSGESDNVYKVQYGNEGITEIPADGYKDCDVTFAEAFLEPPTVMCSLMGYSENAEYGSMSASVKGGSITATGFTLRVYNASISSRSPNVLWTAIGRVGDSGIEVMPNSVNISYGAEDLTPGTSQLANGEVYLVYE